MQLSLASSSLYKKSIGDLPVHIDTQREQKERQTFNLLTSSAATFLGHLLRSLFVLFLPNAHQDILISFTRNLFLVNRSRRMDKND